MERAAQVRFHRNSSAPVNWNPVTGGKRSRVCFDDSLTEDLGSDPTGSRFDSISERMMKGYFYPQDAVQYFCEAHDTGRDLKVHDRVLQRAPLFPFLPSFGMWSMVEIFVASRSESECTLGYVTTTRHQGRGIWQAKLMRVGDRLSMTITSTTSPQSWLFWMGLPLARFLQLRARRRALEEFKKVK